MNILVFNCGSSSLKFEVIQLKENTGTRRLAKGIFDEIGAKTTARMSNSEGASVDGPVDASNHSDAAGRALDWLAAECPHIRLDAVAHRVVHGGDQIAAPTLKTDEVMDALQEAAKFAPLHNPAAIAVIQRISEKLGNIPAIIVTDTGFHRTMPAYARTYALPRELAARHGIHRFGFHGVGHAWMMERYAELTGAEPAKLNLITLQLGAGCSAAAICGGLSIDTSMGLTPLEGLMMATRSGDLDPAIFSYLAEAENMAASAVERMLNRESGMLGVSGLSGDMRKLEEAAASGNENARLAIAMFCYRVRKYIGAYMAVLGRTDAVIFGAGIGEHSDAVRTQICSGLEALGIEIDEQRNRAMNGKEGRISADNSRVAVYVVPLDEELYIARAAARLIASPGPQP